MAIDCLKSPVYAISIFRSRTSVWVVMQFFRCHGVHACTTKCSRPVPQRLTTLLPKGPFRPPADLISTLPGHQSAFSCPSIPGQFVRLASASWPASDLPTPQSALTNRGERYASLGRNSGCQVSFSAADQLDYALLRLPMAVFRSCSALPIPDLSGIALAVCLLRPAISRRLGRDGPRGWELTHWQQHGRGASENPWRSIGLHGARLRTAGSRVFHKRNDLMGRFCVTRRRRRAIMQIFASSANEMQAATPNRIEPVRILHVELPPLPSCHSNRYHGSQKPIVEYVCMPPDGSRSAPPFAYRNPVRPITSTSANIAAITL